MKSKTFQSAKYGEIVVASEFDSEEEMHCISFTGKMSPTAEETSNLKIYTLESIANDLMDEMDLEAAEMGMDMLVHDRTRFMPLTTETA